MRLQTKIVEARQERGMTLSGAAAEIGIAHQSLMYLEGGLKGRNAPSGEGIGVGTAVGLIHTYWPDVNLDDFLPDCGFELVRKDDS